MMPKSIAGVRRTSLGMSLTVRQTFPMCGFMMDVDAVLESLT